MLDFLFRSKHWPIALDLGGESVKMLQMHKVGGLVALCAGGRWRLPDSARDPQQRRQATVEAIREMLRSGKFRGRHVVSSLPCSQLSIKNVRLPHMSDQELSQAVKWEAKERFSFEIAEDQLCCLNAGQVRQGTEVRDEIIMIATTPQAVEEHLSMLTDAGLHPDHIDAEPIAAFRIFERFLRRRADEQAVTVIVDVGLAGSRITLARGRQICFIKSIDIGGQKFTEAVARKFNLSYAEACDLRLRAIRERTSVRSEPVPSEAGDAAPPRVEKGESLEWTIRDALRAEVEALGRELALCVRYCSVTFRGLRAEPITVIGGEAYDPAVVALLSEHLGVPCIVGKPLRGIDTSAVDLGGDRRGMLAEWAVCAGLAIRDVDVPSTITEGEHEEHRLSA